MAMATKNVENWATRPQLVTRIAPALTVSKHARSRDIQYQHSEHTFLGTRAVARGGTPRGPLAWVESGVHSHFGHATGNSKQQATVRRQAQNLGYQDPDGPQKGVGGTPCV